MEWDVIKGGLTNLLALLGWVGAVSAMAYVTFKLEAVFLLTESERAQTTITAVIELPGQDDQKIDIARFIELHPELAPRVVKVLQAHGLAN